MSGATYTSTAPGFGVTTSALSKVGHVNVDDIVSRYVLGSTLPSERLAKAPRSHTPPTLKGGNLNSSPAAHSAPHRFSDIRTAESHQADRVKVDRAGRHAHDVASTVKELERSKNLLSDLENENLQLRTRIRTLSLLVEEKEQSVRDIENSLRSARQQLSETEALRVQDMTSLRKQIVMLQQQNSDLSTRCDTLRTALNSKDSDANMTRDELKSKIQNTETQLETARNTNFRLSHQLEEKEQQVSELQKLQTKVPSLEKELTETVSKLQEIQKLMQGKEEERQKLQEIHLANLRDLTRQLDSWKREGDRLSERGFEQHHLQSDHLNKISQRDRDAIEDARDKVRRAIDELRQRQFDADRLQIEIQKLQSENKSLRELANNKDFLMNESTLLKSQVRQLEENIALLQQLQADLKQQLEKKEAAAAEEESAHLTELAELQKELDQYRSDAESLEHLRKENSKLKKEIHKGVTGLSQEKLSEMRAEKTVLEQEVQDLREKLISMTANTIQVERIYAEQIDELQREVTVLKAKESECRQNHNNPEREKQLRQRTMEIEAENDHLRQRMEANMKLQSEIEAEKMKETIKREQQLILQGQLSSINFAKPDYAIPVPGQNTPRPSPRDLSPRTSAPLPPPPLPSAADVYQMRMMRASPSNASGALPAATSTNLLTSLPSLSQIPHVESFHMRSVPSALPTAVSAGNLPTTSSSPRRLLTGFPSSNGFSLDATAPTAASTPLNSKEATSVIRYTAEGVGSVRFGSVSQLFRTAAEKGSGNVAIRTDRRLRLDDGSVPPPPPGGMMEWGEITWDTYHVKATHFAKALISHRCEINATVMIVSNGAPEASIAFAGSIIAGCLPSTAQLNASVMDIVRQMEETAAEILVLEDVQLLHRLLQVSRRILSVKQYVVFGVSSIPQSLRSEYGQMVATFDQFVALNAYIADPMLQVRTEAQQPDMPACILYTSGATGEPKGVLLSHDNLQFAAAAFAQAMVLTDGEGVSHISLNSIAEAHGVVIDIILPMITVASKGLPFVTHYIHSNNETNLLPQYLRAIRPTFFVANAALYSELLLCITAIEQAETKSESDGKLQLWAKNVAKESSLQRQRDILSRIPTGPIKGAHLAASMNDKIKTILGMDRVVQTICLGGPVSIPLLEGYASCGFDLLQVYSSAETTGLATASAEACFQFGTCGFALPSTEVRIDSSGRASDRVKEGELLIAGRHIMIGYLKHSSAAIQSDGWFRTGDIGRLDNETGLLTIVGRIRDQVVVYPTGNPMAPSDRISPQRLELEISKVCPALSRVVIYGDQRKFLVALMTIKAKKNVATGTYLDELAGEAQLVNEEVLTVTTARRDEKWLKYIATVIAQCNSVVEHPSLKVKRFCILPTDFTVVGGELTLTGKVKRAAVLTKYSALVEKLYAEDNASGSTPRPKQ